MIVLILGFAAVFTALMGVSLWIEPMFSWYQQGDVAVLIARSILAPTIGAWIAAEAFNLVRPPRLLDRRIRRVVPRALAGLAAGIVAAVIAAFLLVVAGERVHEFVILAGSSVVGMLAVLLPMRRVRPGLCIHCQYDLRDQPPPGQPGWGVCPECGAGVRSAGAAASWVDSGPGRAPSARPRRGESL